METAGGLGDSRILGYCKNVKRTLKYTLGKRKSTSERKFWKEDTVLKAGVPISLKKI